MSNALDRRTVLQALGASLGAATLVGCGLDGESADEAVGEAESDLAKSKDMLSQVKKIVVLCMENRSFDHYLGSRKFVEGRAVNGLTGTESNPSPAGGAPVTVFNLQSYSPADPPHEWPDAHAQWDGGQNDGFVIADAGPTQDQVMGYYLRSQLPTTYGLADAFTTCDAYFASVMGPTWPNRFYLHGATSHGVKDATPILDFVSIFDVLTAAGVSSVNYFSDVLWATAAYHKVTGLAPLPAFFADAAAGTLPNFSIIDPQFLGPTQNDDHPASDVRLGQALIATIYAALAKSPDWKHCLFLVVYDEHGGFHDHVAPPTTPDERPEFQQLGFRVPTLAIGPYVRKGVVSTTFDHASIIKTLTNRFNLPVLNQRVAGASDLSSVLDPALYKNPQPAPALPPLSISYSALNARVQAHLLGAPTQGHAELAAAADAGIIPPHLDRRSSGLGSTNDVLAWGQQLGALTIVP